MLVRCPSCQTSYRVADSLITTSKPTFRCSRCKHIFVVALKADSTTTPPAPPSQQEKHEEAEMSFSFTPPSEQAERGEERKEDSPEVPPTREAPVTGTEERERLEFAPPAPEEPTATVEEKGEGTPAQEQTTAQPGDTGDEAGQAPPPPEQAPASPTAPDRQEEFAAELERHRFVFPEVERGAENSLEAAGAEPLSVVPYLSLFTILVVIFAVITVIHRAQPARLESLMKAIPWYGSLVFKNDHLRQGIALRSLRSGFRTILGNRRVFVISGEVVNRNPVAVREIQVEGLIYSAEGKEIGRQAISVGNAISAKIIRDMTAREISILQRLSPSKRFEIPPEDSSPFTIVFLKPGRNIKSFSCRVLAAQGET